MKIKFQTYFIVLLIFSMASCYNYRSTGLLQEKNPNLPVYEKAEYVDYKIQVNDEIIFRLISSELTSSDENISKIISSGNNSSMQNTISYRVYPDGTIDIPFVKSIKVAGLTLEQASKVVEKRMQEIIPDAAIKLSIANKTYTVIGEAGTGVYPIIRDKMTIFQALSASGELNQSGDFRHVRILRENAKGTEVLVFDIRPASIIESKYYYILPNDIIYVQRDSSSFYKVNNWTSFLGLISTSLSLLILVLGQ